MHKLITSIVFILLCLDGISFALDQKNSGVREIDHKLAKATLDNITTHLEAAESVVMNDILPYVSSKLYTQGGTGIYAYLINNTGNTSTFSNWITTVTNTNSGSYIKNPYIYKLAIVSNGLKIQMQFVNNYATPTNDYKTSKLAIFEPFLGKRIILVPHMQSTGCGSFRNTFSLFSNIFYKFQYDDEDDNDCDDDNRKRHKKQRVVVGTDIDYWTCYTDADENVTYSATGIPEGSTSIISIAGGVLDGCIFMTSSNLNNLWVNI